MFVVGPGLFHQSKTGVNLGVSEIQMNVRTYRAEACVCVCVEGAGWLHLQASGKWTTVVFCSVTFVRITSECTLILVENLLICSNMHKESICMWPHPVCV